LPLNLNKSELHLLSMLRSNARTSVTSLANRATLPVRTTFEKLQHLEKKVITKYVTLLDFFRLKFPIRIYFFIATNNHQEVLDFLKKNNHVNSCYLLQHTGEFAIDAIFPSFQQAQIFKEQLHSLDLTFFQEHYIAETLAQEQFLVNHPDTA